MISSAAACQNFWINLNHCTHKIGSWAVPFLWAKGFIIKTFRFLLFSERLKFPTIGMANVFFISVSSYFWDPTEELAHPIKPVAQRMALGVKAGIVTYFSHFLLVLLGTLPALILLIYKIGLVVEPIHRTIGRIKWVNKYEALRSCLSYDTL